MKAAFFEQTGAPDVIKYGDLPDPKPKEGEVLVRVKAASLNPIDTYIRGGAVAMPLPKPFIPGCDLAGVVEEVGPGCKRFKKGDRVWGSNQGLLGRQGSFAELACSPEDLLYPTPDGVSDEEAAAAALVGITAHLGLFSRAGLKSGETVFVNGGTGGVGSMVVQMAKATGAKVVATAGSDEKVELAQSLGADRAINYKSEDVPAAIKKFSPDGVHVWYETLREPNFEQTVDLMAERARIVIMAGRQAQPIFPVGPFYVKQLSLFGFVMFKATPDEQRKCADDINRWLKEKKVKVMIGKTFPLAEAAQAHQLQEDNTLEKKGTLTCKIVIKM